MSITIGVADYTKNGPTSIYPLPVSDELIELFNKVTGNRKNCTISFKDPSYSAETGGYHPIEVMIQDGSIKYITDFAYVGSPPFEELAKEIDFDFGYKVFQHMGREYPIAQGRQLYKMWESNFISYFESGVYTTKTTNL